MDACEERVSEGSVMAALSSEVVSDVDDDRIESAAAQLRAAACHASLELALRVAEILIDTLYDGSPTAWRSRSRQTSLRMVASRPNVPFGYVTLYRALATHEIVVRMGGLQRCVGLRGAHFRHVLSLPSADQVEVLQRAQTNAWSARELADHVGSSKAETGSRRKAPLLRELDRLVRLTASPTGPFSCKTIAATCSAVEADDAVQRLELVVSRLTRTLSILRG